MPVSQEVQHFITNFYRASDVGPPGHEAYVSHFTPDTTLIMGPTEYPGQDGVRKFRETGWEKVETRRHVCKGIFVDGKHSPLGIGEVPQVMCYGTVDYGFKDGTSKDGVEWAARMHLVKDEKDELRLKFYQVYIVRSLRNR